MSTALLDCPALPTTEWMQEPVLVPQNIDQLARALNYLLATRGTHAIGFDTETTGIAATDTVRLIQFATVDAAVVIRLERLGTDALNTVAEWLAHALEDGTRFTAHNLRFDAGMLHRIGVIDAYTLASAAEDTLTLARVLEGARSDGDEDSGKSATSKDKLLAISERNAGNILPRSVYALKPLTQDWLEISLSQLAQAELHQVWEEQGWTPTPTAKQQPLSGWRNVSPDSVTYLRYAGADAIDTARLHSHLSTAINAVLSEDILLRERRIYAWATARELDGFLVDVEGLKSDPILAARAQRLADLNAELKQLGVEPNKPKSVGDAIERELTGAVADAQNGVNPNRPQKLNPRNKMVDSIAKEAVNPFTDRSHIARLLVERAPLAKADSTYGSNWLRYLEKRGGERMFPAIDPHGSTTGRMTMSSPSLLNVPAELRKYLIPRPGYTLLAGDMKAIEVRVGAALAGDDVLIADLQAGRDPYGVVAELVFGKNYTKADRNAVKPVLLGRIYGRQPESVARQECIKDRTKDYNRELALAQRIMVGIDSRWSKLHLAGAHYAAAVAVGRSRVQLPSGRSIPVDPTHAKDALNALVQGAARDLLVDAGLRLLDKGYDPNNLMLAVHDEWVMEVPNEQVEQTLADLEEVLTTTFRGVPIECEVGVLGDRWGKL